MPWIPVRSGSGEVDVPAVTAAIRILRRIQVRLGTPFIATGPSRFRVALIAYHNHLCS